MFLNLIIIIAKIQKENHMESVFTLIYEYTVISTFTHITGESTTDGTDTKPVPLNKIVFFKPYSKNGI